MHEAWGGLALFTDLPRGLANVLKKSLPGSSVVTNQI